jgi:hypothetical protein
MDAYLAAYYWWRPARRTAASDALLLLKYPLIVLVLAQVRVDHWAIALAMLATYAAVVAYEIWHDPSAPLRITLS